MREAVFSRFEKADVVVKAAAVSDWQSLSWRAEAEERRDGELNLSLYPPTIFSKSWAIKKGQYLVGFAAESNELEKYAQAKLQSKGCHMIVANPIGGEDAGFGSDNNQVTIFTEKTVERWPTMSKDEVAQGCGSGLLKNLRSEP